jgi:hypothetical protein
MAARFAGNPEIGAGATPFHSVRRDPASAGAELREQMRQLMAQGLVDFARAVRAQALIEKDTRGATVSAPGGGAQPSRPFHAEAGGESGCVLREQERAGQFLQREITTRLSHNGHR